MFLTAGFVITITAMTLIVHVGENKYFSITKVINTKVI